MFGRDIEWTLEEIDFLNKNYHNTDNKVLSESLYKSRRAIVNKAKRLGLRKYKSWSINHNFFDNWSSDMAYILGNIITDGCIEKKNVLKFGVAKKDRSLLEYICNCMCPNRPIYDRVSKYPSSVLWINSIPIKNKLLEYGIVNCKTGYEILPNCPEQYKPDLLRGIFDGDGCINRNKSTGYLQFYICSASCKFLEDINTNLIFNYGKIYDVTGKLKNNFYVLRINKQKDILTIANYMYYTGYKFCLERKRIKFYE